MSAREAERGLREFLDDWRVWMGIAYFALAFCIVALFVIFGRQADEAARRQATQLSASTAQVSGCFQSVQNAPAVISILDSLDVIVSSSITSSKQALAADPKGELAQIRRRTIARLTPARNNVRRFRDEMQRATPTMKSCTALARRLDVDPDGLKPE